MIKKLVFACVHNAGRSQIAAAWARHLAGGRVEVLSGGTEPGPHLNVQVVEAMREAGVDLAGIRPQLLTPELVRGAEYMVTMGCGESCPVIPGVKRRDWPIADTRGQPIEVVRTIRDEIKGRVIDLLRSEGILANPSC
ncbi:MAG TPA: arsenate reductase ArsC [Terriglobales bacterium]|nr:arsenate reductase ArsC [Terriglobales bacterium]